MSRCLQLKKRGGETSSITSWASDVRMRSVQSWPKVLRMTQILVFTKFAAKLLLDLCFSCFCDVVKYNYTHFIRFKGFYRQLHDIYAKSQYLQCWPFFFRTSAIRLGMLSINFWANSWLIATHSFIITSWSLSELVGFCLSTRLLRIDHKFSMGLRSGEFPGHGPKMSTFWSPSHLVITFALWHGAPSCWKMHCSSPNCCWIVGRSCCWRVFWYHSLFMAVFLGKIVSEPPLPWMRSNPTHEWSQDALLLAWHRTDGSAHLFFSGQAFFLMPQTIGKRLHRRIWLCPSPQQSIHHIFCRRSICPWCFFGEKWLLCCPSWHQAIFQKSSPHCACRCAHTCLLPFLSKLCTGGTPIPQLNPL